MAERATLHLSKVVGFSKWLSVHGWEIEQTKGVYEILRARRKTDKRTIIIYKRDRGDHATIQDGCIANKLVLKYLRAKEQGKEKETRSRTATRIEMKFQIGDSVRYHPIIGKDHDGKIYYVVGSNGSSECYDSEQKYVITGKAAYVAEEALTLAEPSWCTGRVYRVEMPDGSRWDVPVGVIAMSRARYYADEYGENIAKSMHEDTINVFKETEYEIVDWAVNNMDWSDVEAHATKCEMFEEEVDFQDGWVSGYKKVVVIERTKS